MLTHGAPITLELVCHPASPGQPAFTLTCDVSWDAAQPTALQLRYHLQGDLSRLRIPEPTAPHAADGLWQHTCFEAFARRTGAAAYREFNFSPSGQWAAYRFSAQRVRDTAPDASQNAPRLRMERQAHALVLHATLLLDALPATTPQEPLLLGLSTVLQDSGGQLSYWALHHPTAQPDFHHPASFVHTVPLPTLP